MQVEQEQKVTEYARVCSEQDATAQKYAVHVIQVNWLAIIAKYVTNLHFSCNFENFTFSCKATQVSSCLLTEVETLKFVNNLHYC